ncbi:hypothetical protein CDD81_1317 [Ophiocordyceps australis]|uniref:Nuclear membrane fusion protein Kar5 n=1 Tax=Ophiocordyceps australis TaxID=1399860 RepID=A0A2C5XTZ2_9HYPO|nr:hypothetical protein CDD81_1317 [Ophiocordyceps australis]
MTSLWPPSWRCVCCFLLAVPVPASSWRIGRTERAPAASNLPALDRPPSPPYNETLAKYYSQAISELEQLESEPLCHRIAARLLVNNCQLLDGQNDATILTDSGRATRDFVDSYAASLAICDLERGSFAIPKSCSKFRETALSVIPIPTRPQLHVSTLEIDNCLEGLARSDSAWNTWVSYRHKALRFCEAARVETEKDKSIHLFKRMTEIMARLTIKVEADLEPRFQDLNQRILDTRANMDIMHPQVEDIKESLLQIEHLIRNAVSQSFEETATSIRASTMDAKNLQNMLSGLLTSLLETEANITHSHEASLYAVTQRFESKLESVFLAMDSAVETSNSLKDRLTESESQAIEIASQQQKMEASLEKLLDLAKALALKYEDHHESLKQAQRIASHVQHILDSVTASATSFRSSIIGGFGMGKWWPHVMCPVASLILGSYGLPPSAMRNILLIGLGEAAGLAIFGLLQSSRQRQVETPSFANESISLISAVDINGQCFSNGRADSPGWGGSKI